MSLNVVRGLCEPSIIAFRDRFYLTIRNDIKGYVTASNDGLHYQPIKAWTFDDKYLDKPIPPDVLQQVLSAAMYAPSACNQQPWQFVVLVDRKLLREVPKINSYAAMAADAPVAILACGHEAKGFRLGKLYVDDAQIVAKEFPNGELLQAIDRGYRGYFITFPELIRELFQATADRSDRHVFRRYLSYDRLDK